MQWNWLKVFYYVAKYENFTRASEALNISQSAVSYTMNELEQSLQTQVFQRKPRGIKLTNDGILLFEYVKNMQHEFLNIQDNIFSGSKHQAKDIQGRIRIATTTGIAGMWLPDLLDDFIKQYPKINIEIMCSDKSLDIKTLECDIAIRPKINDLTGFIQDHLTTFQLKLFASESYIERTKDIISFNDHRFIAYGGENYRPYEGVNWFLREDYMDGEGEYYIKPALIVNSSEGAFKLAELGHGIISYPDSVPGKENKTLKNIMPEIYGPEVDICCIYSERVQYWTPIMKLTKHLKAFCKKNIEN